MAASESRSPSSIFMSRICAPPSTCWREMDTASSNLPLRISLLKRAEPVTFARSPTLTKLESARNSSASSPLRIVLVLGGSLRRGAMPLTASEIALVCSGVEPQQLPTMLVRLYSANSRRLAAMCAAVSSYSPNSFGSPAFGWQEIKLGAAPEIAVRKGLIWSLPSEQLMPTLSNGT